MQKKISTDKYDKSEFELFYKVRDHCHFTGKFREPLTIFAIGDTKYQKYSSNGS